MLNRPRIPTVADPHPAPFLAEEDTRSVSASPAHDGLKGIRPSHLLEQGIPRHAQRFQQCLPFLFAHARGRSGLPERPRAFIEPTR